MKKTKVLIVDDHAMVRMSLASLLGTMPDLEVIGDAGDGPSAERIAAEKYPDVVVMDLLLPGQDGAETTAKLLAAQPATKVLILTSYGTADCFARALEAGACGAVMKSMEFSELVAAIRTVAAGGRAVSPEIERILDENPPLPELSPRQADILAGIVRGKSNKEIAEELHITIQVVKEYVNTLYAKIGAANRSEAVAIALRKHLLKI